MSEEYFRNPELCKKMKAEQEKYKAWLMEQSPEEILNHAYEYSVRNDILIHTQYADLSDELATALLNSPSPLSDVYDRFIRVETDYIMTIDGSIYEAAFRAFEKAEAEKEKIMTVLVVAPGEKPSVVTIPAGLDSLYNQVGEPIQAIYPFEEPVGIVCNDNGKINGMQLNRALRDDENSIYDIVSGTFLVVGLGEEDFCSLTPKQIEKYSEHFAEPEMFFMLDGEIQAIPYNDPSKFPLYEKPFAEARDREEISAYRLSSRADNMCKTAIEAAINDNYSECRLDPEGAKKVVENFGIDRVKKILALTCIVKDYDGRISDENKAWAKTVRPNDVKDKIDLSLVVDGVNPGLTDIFVRQVKRIETECSEKKPSVLKKLESAKDNIAPASTAPKKKDQVL